MTKKSCRRTMDENKIHEKAVKMRKKTDEQLVHYVEDRVEKARSHHRIRHSKANWMRSTGYLFFGKLCAPDQERVLCRNYRSSVELEERY